MKKATFLEYERPLLTTMVQADNPDRIEELMRLSIPEGAEAFGMQFCKMKAEYRTRETYKRLFESASPFPVYVTNYRGHENKGKDDDTLAAELLELAECGATLCDMMGDYFDPCVGELTTDPIAVQKQMKLVEDLHRAGAEVLMSSHVLKFTPAERVLEIATEHQKRGVDICKIVVKSNTMEEQIENMRILRLLKEHLSIPFLFLCGGESRILRCIGGTLGSCMSLCVYEHDEYATSAQPLLKDVKMIRDLMEVKAK
jgi:3-dehydroquinate dehydratase